MLNDRNYLLGKAADPSMPKLFLDTKIVPLAVNALGRVEVALNRASARTGMRSAVIVVGVMGVVSLGLVQLLRKRASQYAAAE